MGSIGSAGSIGTVGSITFGDIGVGTIGAAGSIGSAGSIGTAGSIADVSTIPSGGNALRRITLASLPLVGTTWANILAGTTLALQPLQAITFYDMATYPTRSAPDAKTPWERLAALPINKVPFITSLWRSVPLGALLLGNTPLNNGRRR